MTETRENDTAGVAIIGLAGRFPGAATVEQLWHNLRAGIEAISFFSDESLRAAGVDPALLADPRYVKAAPVLEGVDLFDAPFFGLTAREAEILDPQQRLFLEHAWAALESAGYDAQHVRGSIGLFAGAGMNAYLWANLSRRPDVLRASGFLQVLLGNEKDYLATRTAYALNLRGPAINVQTACSTALVAVHLASQALLDYHCDMALAGAVRVAVPQVQGYLYQEGDLNSPDGHCRPFDARAQGTLFGSGVGVVVLKRLEDALEDGDTIRAVIRGTAVNNDGSLKVGFTAPGVDGQSGVIAEALAAAGVEPDTISYVEAHGTATPLGDPIEVQALSRAFRARTRRKGFCALGSVKSNLGHLDTAAGMAGLIKTVLALEHREIPPSLHFEAPNPQIDFSESPFVVNDRLRPWTSDGPRRAGVSSFGMGGTNAHLILEEAPPAPAPAPARPWQLLVLSARTAGALERATDALAAHLGAVDEASLADVAFTLQMGRRRFEHRRAVVCGSAREAREVLESRDSARLLSHAEETGGGGERSVAFLFPGQGAQYPGMGRDLYRDESVFRREVDRAAEILRPLLGLDLRDALYPAAGADLEEAAARLRRTDLAQAALFAVEHALARLWMSWGVRPQALIGHSIGEYVAACLAGVFSLEDALALVAARGRAMRDLPTGAMLGVQLPEAEVGALLEDGFQELDLAAVNAPDLVAVAGPEEAVERLRHALAERGLEASRLHTSHAFHSRGMEPAAVALARETVRRPLNAPQIPFVSNLTGTWIRAEEATDPGYWARHLREPVRFAAGLEEILRDPARVLLEAGPGRTLAGLARRHPALGSRHAVVTSLPAAREDRGGREDLPVLLEAAARLWLLGVDLSWGGFHGGARRRVPLPTYPFERLRYWVDPPAEEPRPALAAPAAVEAAAEPVPAPARQAAPRASHARPLLATGYLAPRDERERALAALWEEKLGVTPVGVADDFFELGGHSLLATQVAAAVRRAFETDAPLRDLFATPTVAGMAAVIAARGGEGAAQEALPILVPAPQRACEPFPLTDVQAAYWIGRGGGFDLGGVGTHSYFEMEAAGLDLDRFVRALRLLIGRHGMLRAVVMPDGVQRVLPEVPPYDLQVQDLRGEDPAAAEEKLLAVRARMSHQVLPADRWPLFEIRASILPDGRIRFHVSFDFLIGDAWSMLVLGDELGRLYRDPAALPPPPVATFRDYVLAEAALQESALFRRSREYWQGRLETLPPAPELPLAVNPAEVRQVRFARRRGRLDAAAWERFKATASRAGLTLSAAVLAAFAEVLAAWSKSPRFTLNLTLFNRLPLHPEVDRIVGDFTSLTLLEVDAAVGETFAGRARLVQRRLWDDLDHRHVGGVRVLRELARTRGAGAAVAPVVFTSLLTLSEADVGTPAESGGEGLSLAGVYGVSQTPQVWLDHQASERAGCLDFNWDAVEELFPPGLLDDMLGVYLDLLQRLAAGEAAWQERAPLRLPPAHLEVYAAANATAAPLPDGLLHHPFLARALEAPERTAVVSRDRTLSYGELQRLARGLGRRLRERGVVPGSHVAVVMTKGWEQVAAVLGIHAAGGAYLPVDAELPRERREYLLRHGEVRVALTQPRWATLEWPAEVEPLVVTGGEGEDGAWPEPARAPQDLAYTIFTSGSTGVPKGVMIDHRGALNTVVDVNTRFRLGPEDRVLAVSSLSFDLSVWDVFGLLAAGGALVLPEPEAHRDPARWLELLEQERVSVWNTVPALMEMLVEHTEGIGARLPASLRLVLMSGDWVPVGLPDRIRALCPRPVEIVSLGGATEASIWSILYPIGEVDPSWRSIPYGRAMVNQGFHVLDGRLEPRPLWVPGDLFITGSGLAQGYWRDPEKTAASFVIHPETGERLYRTGDLGRWRPDGSIEFLGREDSQVKIQGHRIELGEIEAALARHPGVRLAAAAAVGERGRGRRLVGYVVPEEGRPVDAGEFQAWLAGKVPSYMVPAALVVLDAMPLTANGKVDRKALPEPEALTLPAGAASLRTPIEELLAGIWEEVLGIAGIGPGDDFYTTLGGDSLLATRVVSRIRERLGIEISLRSFFEAPTVSGLAARVEEARGGWVAQAPPLVPVPREVPGGALPLSFAQQRLWFLDQLEPDSAAYNIPFALTLRGILDRSTLVRAVSEIVRRHEVLRTVFSEQVFIGQDDARSEPVQRILPAAPLPLPQVDLGALPPVRRVPEAARLAREEAGRPFDLERGPLVRAALLCLDPWEHVALLTLHHIVSDAWSAGIFVREMGALYSAFTAGLPSPLPEPPIQYADYAAWQRRWLQGEELEARLSYWQQRLAGAPSVLALPADRARPPLFSGRGAVRTLFLSGREAGGGAGLAALGRQHGLTPFMTLLAVFDVLLARITGSVDLVVGTDVANRNRAETEGLIGFFVNQLVLRVDLSGDPCFRDLFGQVRTTALDAYDNQDLPFEKLVEELRPERDLSLHPVFQVTVAFELEARGLELPGLNLSPFPVQGTTAKFDLALSASESPAGLFLKAEHSTDLFDATTIDRLLGHLVTMLEAAAALPEIRIFDVPLLAGPEQHQIVHEWNDSAVRHGDESACFPQLFAARAASDPAVIAAGCDGEVMTYGELDRAADLLAGALAAQGVERGSVVALLADRGLGFLTAVLGIFKVGAAYLPLDPRQPVTRLAGLVTGSAARAVVVQESYLPALESALAAPARPPLLALEELLASSVVAGPSARSRPLSAADLAYVIYTSGSTGTPKGAMLTHGGMLNHLWAKVTELGLTSADVVAQTASQSFDISVWQFLAALLVGGRVEIFPDGTANDPERLPEAVERKGITILETVPSLLRALMQALFTGDGVRLAFTELRWLIPTGEALPPDLCRDWLRLYPRVPLLNAYGPTECSDDVSHHPIHVPPGLETVNTPIGRPVDNLRLYVVDHRLSPLPVGVPGELCVGGAGVGRGYLGEAGRTADVFVPDSFSGFGTRLYRTGDRARWRPDGAIEYLGRGDGQVKIRGIRIELGEIEVALRLHPAVRDAAVAVREDRPGAPRLVAYPLLHPGAELSEAELREFLTARLPEPLVPSAWIWLDAFPLSPNGKLDRRALPAPAQDASARVLPRGPVEQAVACVWEKVLGVEGVGAFDDFFALGGHSLLATQVAARLRTLFRVDLPVVRLFEKRTVVALSGEITGLRGSAEVCDEIARLFLYVRDLPGDAAEVTGPIGDSRTARTDLLPPSRFVLFERLLMERGLDVARVGNIEPYGGNGPFPLSLTQERLWFLDQMEGGSATYNLVTAARLLGSLNPATLVRCLGEIARRHDSLRTTFQGVGGSPVQVIWPPSEVDLPTLDLAALPIVVRNSEVRRQALEEARRPFDLAEGPLVRASLLHLDHEEHVLILAMHHIISDGWSTVVFQRELSTLYGALSQGRPSPLPELAIQYHDFARWQREWLAGEILEAQLAYWRRTLLGAPTRLLLPTDRPRPAVQTTRGGLLTFQVAPQLVTALRAFGREEGATLFMVLLAGFKVLLRAYTGQDDIVVGSHIANRRSREVEGLIGFFVNTLVLRTGLGGAPTCRELLVRVRETTLGAYAHQDLPFSKLVEALAPERDRSHNPLFQVVLNLDNIPPSGVADADLAFELLPLHGGSAKFDLGLELREGKETLEGLLTFNADLFDQATAARMLKHYRAVLQQMVDAPDRPLSSLSLSEETDTDGAVADFNTDLKELE